MVGSPVQSESSVLREITSGDSTLVEPFGSKEASARIAIDIPRQLRPHPVNPALIEKLRIALKSDTASWLSAEQAQAVQMVTNNSEHHSIIVLPTAGGKTILYVIAAMYAKAQGTYVVAVPNRSLLEDLKRRMQEYGIESSEWKGGSVPADVPILFVSADVLCQPEFLMQLQALKSNGTLKGIFMDECQKWESEGYYRYRLQDPTPLAGLGVPLHLLTATLKPGQEETMVCNLGLHASNFAMIRASTDKPNLEYRVMRIPDSGGIRVNLVMTAVLSEAKSKTLEKGELGLIITRSVDMAVALSKELGCGFFHRSRDDKGYDPQDSYQKWQEERLRDTPSSPFATWLCSTPLIDTGNDTRGLKHTMFCEPPFDFISFLQGAGRTAREGQHGTVTIFYDTYKKGALNGSMNQDFSDVEGVRLYLENTTTCRRFFITERWDEKAVSCGEVPNAALCDICQLRQRGVDPFVPATRFELRTVEEALVEYDEAVQTTESDIEALIDIHQNVISTGACPLHLTIRSERVAHSPSFCPLMTNIREFRDFEKRLKWQAGFVCYACFFPHSGKDLRFHKGKDWMSCKNEPLRLATDPEKTTFGQHSKQFVSGAMYALTLSGELREKAERLTGFGRVPTEIAQLGSYLTAIKSGCVLPAGLVLMARVLKGAVRVQTG